MARLTIHSAMCGECGGWEDVKVENFTDHCSLIICACCESVLLNVRHVEKRPDDNPRED